MQTAEKKSEGQNFTTNVDRLTHRRLKIQAMDERRPMAAIVRDAIRNYLDLAQTPNGKYAGPK